MASNIAKLKRKLGGLLPELDERQRRLLLASEAIEIGHGGITVVAEIAGVSRNTIRKGIQELNQGSEESGRVRSTGGGRKSIVVKYPQVVELIEEMLEPDVRGDPESPLRWTCKSVRNISDYLSQQGVEISYRSVANVLHDLDYSLKGNKKTKEGKSHPDRDRQFKFINRKSKTFINSFKPVISVDTKKKELIGEFANAGKEWSQKGKSVDVNSHDFPDPKVPKAVPYGIYDIGSNKGWVNVGISSDTAEFAVSSIRHWWRYIGSKKYTGARELLICADSGGSNGYRLRLWKKELQRLANDWDFSIHVCHFPPGTSKWNKIEHRLFSFISMNWRGVPLTSYQVIISLIASTRNNAGLEVKARLDKKKYKRGIKVSDKEMKNLKITRSSFQGDWNYKIAPQKS